MGFFRSIRNFIRAFIKGGGQQPGTTTQAPKSGGLDIEVEKNRPC